MPGAPNVSGISPNYGPESGGNHVTITGSGFTGATGVTFGTVAATSYSVVSDSEIQATVPSSSSANNVQVLVNNSGGSSKKICVPIIPLPGCSAATYSYLTSTPWNFSTPVNLNNISVPIPGCSTTSTNNNTGATATTSCSILVSATGGTLSVNGSLGYAVDANIVPAGFVSSGTVSISNLTVTFKGQIGSSIEIPLPLGLPEGLDVYVTINPSVQVGIPISLLINASWTFAVGMINGQVLPMTSTLTCQGVNITSLPSAFGTCINASATAPSLAGLQANLVTSPLWLQVGPSGLNAGIGPQVGISAGFDNVTAAPYWEICAGLGWAIQASILSKSGNLLGPVQIDGSSSGNPKAYCPMGIAS